MISIALCCKKRKAGPVNLPFAAFVLKQGTHGPFSLPLSAFVLELEDYGTVNLPLAAWVLKTFRGARKCMVLSICSGLHLFLLPWLT